MANAKQGFAFYRNDTDRYQDIKIKRLKKEFKCDGVCVYDHILNELYRVKGYYLEWDANVAFDIAEYWDLQEQRVLDIVNYCCLIKLFDNSLLTKFGIITSKSIQSRFKNMCQISKRSDNIIQEEYRLIPEESDIIPEECIDVTGSLPQRREEKRIKKNKKEERVKNSPSLSVFDEVLGLFKLLSSDRNWTNEFCTEKTNKFIDEYENNWPKNLTSKIKYWISIEKNNGSAGSTKPASNSRAWPDYYDADLDRKLSPSDHQQYGKHLINNHGYKTEKDDHGKFVRYFKPEPAQTEPKPIESITQQLANKFGNAVAQKVKLPNQQFPDLTIPKNDP
ncbi:DUF4373 domain-containing protein [Mucilaginibacter gossypii]|uniref:DUF4373 domain-containing protein n=1 Tax=Mucilaginibacter gossypii TaxID=551996 RepID=UPI000DCAE8EA|nr:MULTISPECIES: DUF4373 domain-containing protein [Mucilaginibacter]QTE37498.1 DUF4373 domain-containing protein [Mucilaginibacter gossypii]RAV52323.1 hypothetical protein DIU36_24625 [Mucilaginibacter rubeus]